MAATGRLEDREWLKRADPSDMLGLVEALPQQCREAERIARSMPWPRWSDIRQVVVVGMGGSAISAEFLRSVASEQGNVPIIVCRNDKLPAWVDKHSLVVAVSYSGNTEETLAAYAAAKQGRARIAVITTGGELATRAVEDGYPVVRIPSGLPPRAAIGYTFVPLLVMGEQLGFLPDQAESLAEATELLEGQRAVYGRMSPASQNPAKSLAAKLVDQVPLVLGTEGRGNVAAYRWKCQCNENSKAAAFWNSFPELTHNEVVGWQQPEDVLRRLHVVLLRDTGDGERNNRRIDITKQIMGQKAEGITEFWAQGDSPVARLLSLVYPGDFVATYLALLYETDPTPITAIDKLKQAIK
ncbi:MAG: bifunctional phosphoglucose/phosphomannose isomerase [Limnochordia bacterium]